MLKKLGKGVFSAIRGCRLGKPSSTFTNRDILGIYYSLQHITYLPAGPGPVHDCHGCSTACAARATLSHPLFLGYPETHTPHRSDYLSRRLIPITYYTTLNRLTAHRTLQSLAVLVSAVGVRSASCSKKEDVP